MTEGMFRFNQHIKVSSAEMKTDGTATQEIESLWADKEVFISWARQSSKNYTRQQFKEQYMGDWSMEGLDSAYNQVAETLPKAEIIYDTDESEEAWTEFFKVLEEIDDEDHKEDTRPTHDPHTGRELIYDKYTGEALDAETLIPIDNFIDFSNKPLL